MADVEKQAVLLPAGAPAPKQCTTACRVIVAIAAFVFILVVVVAVVIGVLVADFVGEEDNDGNDNGGYDNGGNDNGGNDDIDSAFPIFPEEVRNGDDYIGLFFLEPVSQAVGDAFVKAADRWSDIMAGSENLMPNLDAENGEFCDIVIPGNIRIDHLFIFSSIAPDDGPGGVLGFAGPCALLLASDIPVFGIMSFDSEDVDSLILEGSFESVILHEMAHVFGLGTLWSGFRFELAINELPDGFANPLLPSPTYIGLLGSQEFTNIGGVGALGIEDGFTDGVTNFAGPGSINGHFDEDSMNIELMTFQIKVAEPPLSSVSIRSLADLGYTVDATFADFFTLNTVNTQSLQSQKLKNEIVMSDIGHFNIQYLE